MGYYTHDLSPFLWQFNETWGIRYYGLSYLAGFLVVYFGLRWFRARQWSALTDDQIGDLMVWVVVGVLLGGRLGYALFYDWHRTVADPVSIFAFWRAGGIGGMASHGGVVGVLLALLWFTRKQRIDFWQLLDNLSVLGPVGVGLGRIANFINGELWGRPTSVPWAVIFPEAGPEPRHPSQLYQAMGEGFLLCGILFWLRGRGWPTGVISGLFLILYAINRTIAEFFREPDRHIGFYFGWLTQGQLLSVGLFLAGVIMILCRVRAGRA
jgi:phosphatidylglycerol:prolipoprotein diacylglycerol transferase